MAVGQKIESFLHRRPNQEDLVQRNIIHADEIKVAPALHSAMKELERSKIEDKLEHLLEHRPSKEELVQQHILIGMPSDSMLRILFV